MMVFPPSLIVPAHPPSPPQKKSLPHTFVVVHLVQHPLSPARQEGVIHPDALRPPGGGTSSTSTIAKLGQEVYKTGQEIVRREPGRERVKLVEGPGTRTTFDERRLWMSGMQAPRLGSREEIAPERVSVWLKEPPACCHHAATMGDREAAFTVAV